jgi:amino acid transporter
MDFSGSINHYPDQENLRLSIMFVLFLLCAGSLWLLLRRDETNHSEELRRSPSKRLKRLFLIGGISLLCVSLMALVYYSYGPKQRVTTTGTPFSIAFLPVSHWGFGVSELEIDDRRSERSSYCASGVLGVCFRFGFIEYRRFEWPPPCIA